MELRERETKKNCEQDANFELYKKRLNDFWKLPFDMYDPVQDPDVDPLVLPSAVTNMSLLQFIRVYEDISDGIYFNRHVVRFVQVRKKLNVICTSRKFNKFIKKRSFDESDPAIQSIKCKFDKFDTVSYTIKDLKELVILFS